MSDTEKTCRELYWSEIDDKEKIERLRQEFKQFQRRVEDLEVAVDFLKQHQHGISGEPTARIESRTELSHKYPEPRRTLGNDVYF